MHALYLLLWLLLVSRSFLASFPGLKHVTKAREEPGNRTSRLGSGLVGASSGCGLGRGYYLSESLEVEHQYVW